jgi:hypothetical protein
MKRITMTLRLNQEVFIKLALIFCIVLLNVNLVAGQEKEHEINPEDIPVALRQAIQQDFPSHANVKWYTFDVKFNEWAMISTDKGDQGVVPDYYVASIKDENTTINAVYNKEGKLSRSETIVRNMEVPHNIAKSISNEYPGWNIMTHQIIIKDFDHNKKYYMVKIRKDGKKKTLFFNSDGNRVKRIRS